MSKESEKELKKQDQEEMKEESHQLELKDGYVQDEKYDESEEQDPISNKLKFTEISKNY